MRLRSTNVYGSIKYGKNTTKIFEMQSLLPGMAINIKVRYSNYKTAIII